MNKSCGDSAMNTEYPIPPRAVLKEQKERILARIYDHHLRKWAGSAGNVFFISDAYPGVWLEHLYDGVSWADYMPTEHVVSKNHIEIFLDRQTEEGQLPCYIWENETGYGWTQECVSVGSVCLEAIQQNPEDEAFLPKCYRSVSAWVNWLSKTHMTRGTGLIEMFCGFDTGHDNSARLDGLKYKGENQKNGKRVPGGIAPDDCDVLPMLAPDMNACFFGNLMSLSKMAELLGKPEEAAEWKDRALDVRKKMFEYLWDAEDQYFYDVDKHGEKRKIRSIFLTNVISEGVMEPALVEETAKRYLFNENEFWTPYPMPAVIGSEMGTKSAGQLMGLLFPGADRTAFHALDAPVRLYRSNARDDAPLGIGMVAKYHHPVRTGAAPHYRCSVGMLAVVFLLYAVLSACTPNSV